MSVDQSRAETQRLGSYEIVRKIARGGMAELFLTRTIGPEGFEKLVVLKKILPNHAQNPKFVRLFLDEARLAATLDHPHIAHVYDMGKVDGHYFFTMEYVHGQDMRSTLRRSARLERRFPLDHAVQIARNVAAALHYAHERRRPDGTLLDIVHRDVSPSNILISYDGAVKLVDFGVAKAATSTTKTRTGTLKGKIAYMSPEQAKGAPIDRRSDIFSLGIVLWELVTGQRLFKADNDLATIQMIINSKPTSPSKLRSDCMPELERIIARALENDLGKRYQTAEQLQVDLEELAREHKLTQSSVALRTLMHELFADEIRLWSLAQAAGQTLTEHMKERAPEYTTPVSESELYSLEEVEVGGEEDDDEEGRSTYEQPDSVKPTALLGVPTQQMAVPSPPDPPPFASPLGPAASVGGHGIGHDQAATVQLQTPTDRVTPFPIAPAEWRPPEPTLSLGLYERRTKQIIVATSIAFGASVILAMALIARDPQPPSNSSRDRLEMKSAPSVDMTPTPVEPAAEQPAMVAAPPSPSPETLGAHAAVDPAAEPGAEPAGEQAGEPAAEPQPAATTDEPATASSAKSKPKPKLTKPAATDQPKSTSTKSTPAKATTPKPTAPKPTAPSPFFDNRK